MFYTTTSLLLSKRQAGKIFESRNVYSGMCVHFGKNWITRSVDPDLDHENPKHETEIAVDHVDMCNLFVYCRTL